MANRRLPDVPNSANPVNPADPAVPAGAPTVGPPSRARKAPLAAPAPTRVRVTSEARRALIAEKAYLRAERRGFEPGYEREDWLAAELEVDALLRAEHGSSQQ
jgi:hypothetical protein